MAIRSSEWRLALVAVAAGGVLVVAGGAFLFTGSTVGCEEVAAAGKPALRCAFVVAAAPEVVWDAFVGTGEPRPYYFDAVLQADLRPRGRWRFVTDDLRRLLAGGEILAFEPPHHFAQTFAAADLDDPPSRITVTLAAVPEGTRVELLHDRFPNETTTYRRFRRAHPLALSAMKSVLETGALPFRARLYTEIFKPGMKLVTAPAEPWS
ncbi:MAG TPA: SRPBCC domain-containing protein [Thermoanaerobaculia bacterium]|nr:SRPBCC domain-containing protein [Thermoanaerobaculia bacterium]